MLDMSEPYYRLPCLNPLPPGEFYLRRDRKTDLTTRSIAVLSEGL